MGNYIHYSLAPVSSEKWRIRRHIDLHGEPELTFPAALYESHDLLPFTIQMIVLAPSRRARLCFSGHFPSHTPQAGPFLRRQRVSYQFVKTHFTAYSCAYAIEKGDRSIRSVGAGTGTEHFRYMAISLLVHIGGRQRVPHDRYANDVTTVLTGNREFSSVARRAPVMAMVGLHKIISRAKGRRPNNKRGGTFGHYATTGPFHRTPLDSHFAVWSGSYFTPCKPPCSSPQRFCRAFRSCSAPFGSGSRQKCQLNIRSMQMAKQMPAPMAPMILLPRSVSSSLI